MARRVQEIESDMETDAPTAPAPIVHVQSPVVAAPPPILGGDAVNGGIYWSGGIVNGGGNVFGGGVLGGGVLAQTTGTYAQVNQNDTFNGTAGDDFFHGGYGDDMIFGFAGKDSLHGDAGADFIAGGMGDDWIDGGTEADILFGESGKDHLFGGAGNDRMNGGTENDKLDGGAGADIMTGGTGADFYTVGTVEFGPNGEIVVAKDTITDFSTATGSDDVLFVHEAISMLTDFNQRFGGNSLPSTAVQHGYVVFVQHGNPFFGDFGTTVYVDSNGDQAGGQRWAVAELDRVAFGDLNFGLPGYGGNLFV